MKRWWCAAGAALASACLPELDVRSSSVDEPRLLAVIAEPPEARPGASVHYTPLAVDGSGRVSRPAIVWSTCSTPKPSSENGAVATDCLLEAPAPLPPAAAELTAPLPLDACARFGPDPPPGDARPRDPDGTGGFYQPLILFAAGQRYVHLQRLVCNPRSSPVDVARELAARYVPNNNPPAPELVLGLEGADVSALPVNPASVPAGQRLVLALELPAGSAEAYVSIDPERRLVVPRREALLVSWFATAGQFDADRHFMAETDGLSETEASAPQHNLWTAPSQAGPAVLWVVVRDDRGGTSFIERELDIVPP